MYKKIFLTTCLAAAVFGAAFFFLPEKQLHAEPVNPPEGQIRCSVCGMFVAKYPAWLTVIKLNDGKQLYFDGVKDLFVCYFDPAKYGFAKEQFAEIWVKDYYMLSWVKAQDAFFVTGSDVYGPMGHEFIPFSSQEAAESFLKDHKGKAIVRFDEVTSEQVESMRMGQKMK